MYAESWTKGSQWDAHLWACDEFGQANLGDARRTRRLVQIASQTADHPAGRVTQVFSQDNQRQGAYGFLENDAIEADQLSASAHLACARRCASHPLVFIAVDPSSLTLTDLDRHKGTGPIETDRTTARGFQVMSAITVSPQGTPLGLCGQKFWARSEHRVKLRRKQRPFEQKETHYFLDVVKQTEQAFEQAGIGCKRWYQFDAGGDSGDLLAEAVQSNRLLTVRAAQNRCLQGSPYKYLWQHLEQQPMWGVYSFQVPQRPIHKERTAVMSLQAGRVTLSLPKKSCKSVEVYAVLVREVGTTPKEETPLEWLLLTTYRVRDFEDACLVLFGYAQRWRVEEFHRTWKQGACRVEDNQLRSASSICAYSGHHDHLDRRIVITQIGAS